MTETSWSLRLWRGRETSSEACRAARQSCLEGDPQSQAFQLPGVAEAWWATVGSSSDLEPVSLLARRGETQVFLPLVVASHPGRVAVRRVLEPLGQARFGYHEPSVSGPDPGPQGWAALWAAVREATAGLADQARLRFLSRSGQGPLSERCSDESPVLELAGHADLAALLGRCSPNHRGDVRRRRRRLAERGEIELWAPGPAEAEEAERDLLEACFAAVDRQAEPLVFATATDRSLGRRLLQEGIPAGWAHYAVLRVAGRSIAWHLGLVHREELYWWFPTHDPDHADLSPGKVLLSCLIEHALARGYRRLHFLTGQQPYKLAWRPEMPALRTVRWHAPGVRGRLFAAYDRWRQG